MFDFLRMSFCTGMLCCGVVNAAPTFSAQELKLFDEVLGGAVEKLEVEEIKKKFTSMDFKSRKEAFEKMKKLSAPQIMALSEALMKLGEVDPEFKARVVAMKNFGERKAKLPHVRTLKGQVNISTGMPTVGSQNSKFINDGDWSTEANPRSSAFNYGIVFGEVEKPQLYEVKHIVVNWGVYGGYYLKDKVRRQDYISNYRIQYMGEDGRWVDVHSSMKASSEEKNKAITLYSKKATDYYTGTYAAHLELKKPVKAKGIRVTAASRMHWIKLLELEVFGQKAK